MLDPAFLDLVIERPRAGDMYLETRAQGDLVIRTGRLVACHPYDVRAPIPAFLQRVPVGQFPVSTLFTCFEAASADEEPSFCAMVRFSAAWIASWEEAMVETDPRRPAEYSVSRHRGCFADGEATPLLADPSVAAAIRDRSRRGSALNNLGSLVVFEAGLPDAPGRSYFGRSASGEIAACVTDLGIESALHWATLSGLSNLARYHPADALFLDPFAVFCHHARRNGLTPSSATALKNGDLQDLWDRSLVGYDLIECLMLTEHPQAAEVAALDQREPWNPMERRDRSDWYERAREAAVRVRAIVPRAPSLEAFAVAYEPERRRQRERERTRDTIP